jgi:hypothetical protein
MGFFPYAHASSDSGLGAWQGDMLEVKRRADRSRA